MIRAGAVHRLTLVGALLVIESAGCGKGDGARMMSGAAGTGGGAGTGGAGRTGGGNGCDPLLPTDPASLSAMLGSVEAQLVAAGRNDANFATAFGDSTDAVLAAADALEAQSVEAAAAAEMIPVPAGAPAAFPDPSACGVTVSALTGGSGQAWESAAFLATGNLLLAVDGNQGDVSYPPLDGDMTFGNVTVHIHQTTHVTLTLDKSHATAAVSMTKTVSATSAQGAPLGSTTETAAATIDVDFCPDSAGVSPGMITVSGDGTVTPAGGAAPSTYHVQATGTFKVNVNDQAATSSVDLDGSVDYTASGGDSPVDLSVSFSSANKLISVQRADGPQTDIALLERSALMIPTLASTVAESAAKKKWQGGACVEVHAEPGSMMVDANATVTVAATPFQKFEMAELNAPVVATLMGVQSLNPHNQAVKSPASFNYVAGSKTDDQGTVSLKSTSKRGIGTGSATYTVKCDEQMTTMCAAGQTLNSATCKCEGCFIDSAGNPSNGCTWSGTIDVTGSSSGQTDDGLTQWTWAFNYQASLSVVAANGGAAGLTGTVDGSWHKVGKTVNNVGTDTCTVTNTTDDNFSGSAQGQFGVTAPNGMLRLSVKLPTDSGLNGTYTTQVSDALCGGASTRSDHVTIYIFDGSGAPTGTTFAGSNVDFYGPPLPSGGDAALNVTWNLRVVPQ